MYVVFEMVGNELLGEVQGFTEPLQAYRTAVDRALENGGALKEVEECLQKDGYWGMADYSVFVRSVKVS